MADEPMRFQWPPFDKQLQLQIVNHSLGFHTEGVDGHAIQEIYYPPDTWGRGRQDHEWEMKRSERRGGPYGARLRSVYAEVQWQRFANRDFRLFCQFGAISAHLRAEIIERQ
jgi:hypothetical protein